MDFVGFDLAPIVRRRQMRTGTTMQISVAQSDPSSIEARERGVSTASHRAERIGDSQSGAPL